MRDGLGSEALSAALHPEKDDPLRVRDAELPGLRRESSSSLLEPALQVLEASDIGHAILGRQEVEDAFLPEALLLDLQNRLDVRSGQCPVFQDRHREGSPRLLERQTLQAFEQPGPLLSR